MDQTLTFAIIAKDVASKTFAGVGKAASGLGKSFAAVGKAGALGLAAVGAGVVALGPQLVDAAGNLQLMENKSKIVFGNQIGRVQDWADANAHAMGLTKREAVGLAAGMADLLVPMGFTRKAAADMSMQVNGLSGALAEWSGGTKSAAEVSEILNAALLGERDSLQSLGIGISQAQVDAQVLANKKKGLTFATEEQADAQATLDLIMAKSTDAQKAFADGAGSLARRTKESKARLKEMGDTILVTATPMLLSMADAVSKHVMPKLEKFVTWFSGPGKYQVAETALGMAETFLTFATSTLNSIARMARGMTTFLSGALAQAGLFAKAMGNDGLAGKLIDAAGDVTDFGQDVASTLEGASSDLAQWNQAVRTMKDKVTLQANIADLEQKLDSAKRQLKDKNLTKERRASINANIEALKKKIAEAKRALDRIPDETVYVNYVGRSTSGRNRNQDDLGPGRATGGPTVAGRIYKVGERGPEWFAAESDGYIIPNGGTTGGPFDWARQKKSASAGAAAAPAVLEIHSGGSRLDDLIVEIIRHAVRVKGGNVQLALGPKGAR